ncbi:hypothetical protein [Polaromonas sp. AER18D-145]|uniref:hypothetical protein n=1 Tax=Polaromonas sp. AER18D-145 TaxID=1977060 RepID=UPI0011441D40|nr:hypothetical protein [Polaromonas sp. AER18D-145]
MAARRAAVRPTGVPGQRDLSKKAGYLCEQRKNSFSGSTADAPSARPGRENTSGHKLPVFFLKINTLLFSEALFSAHRIASRHASAHAPGQNRPPAQY